MSSINNDINNTSSFLNLGPNGTSASTSTMLVAQNNQNAISAIKVVNATAGTAARTDLQVSSDGGGGYFGTASSLYTGLARFQNKAFITTDTGMAGVVLDAPAASGTVTVYTNSSLVATFTASQTLTLANPLVVASGGTGVGTLASNGVLYGNGTSAIQVTAAGTTSQVLIGGSGPSFTSTLPSTVQGNITAVGTLASGTVPASLVTGATNGSFPSAGNIGEIISSTTTTADLANGTPTNVTSIALTAGNWFITAWTAFFFDVAGTTSYVLGSISGTSATVDSAAGNYSELPISVGTGDVAVPVGYRMISISSGATYYLIGQIGLLTGNVKCKGIITATRIS